MTSDEFIKQQISAGYDVHYNRGVWWQKFGPFFYKPVSFFQPIIPTESFPKFSKSFLGYKHVTSDNEMANEFWPVMLMEEDILSNFDLMTLNNTKRKHVKKGLKLLKIERIEQIEPVIDDMKHICISTRQRTDHGKPIGYYHTEQWRTWIRKEFSLPKREWWGAYDDNKLIAYLYGFQIDDTMFAVAIKCYNEFLDKRPSDALYFSFINYCKDLSDCKQVEFGDGGDNKPSINEYKKQFGFKEVNLPVYAKYNPLVLIYKLYKKRSLIYSREKQ